MTVKSTLLAALVVTSSAAWAGLYQPAPVEVDLDAGLATGDMLTAANDKKNDDVFIGCGTRNFDDGAGGVFSSAFCQAEDAEGDNITCFTENVELVAAIRAISDFSFIVFRWTDDGFGGAVCTSIGISTQSFYLDKVK